MKAEARRHHIIEQLIEQGSVTVEALSSLYDVSLMTIHRDLDALAEEGVLRKIRGGATIESSGQFESDFSFRERIAANEKQRIAARAAELIESGMSVLIDDGTTANALVPHLINKSPLTVITNNQAIIDGLTNQPGIQLISLGGMYSKKFHGYFGIITESAVANLRTDLALISTSSIIGTTAFHQYQEVAAVRKGMMQSSGQCYLLVDHQKFGRTALHLLAELSAFDGIVTSPELSESYKRELKIAGIPVLFADKG